MASIADYANAFIEKWNGRKVSADGEDINADGRFGVQCMDLWLKFRYGLGHTEWLPTPDAAAVWEMNNNPGHPMWLLWDGITPDQPAQLGDIFIMNRNFFGNGVGHIGMVIADLGSSIRVLETNGLGDGYEDDYMNQYGSPARIHDWPKTYLYGYLRWVGQTPDTIGSMASTITPIEEDDMFTDEDRNLLKAVKEAIFDGGESMKYGASLQNLIDDVPRRAADLVWSRPVIRGTEKISALQELADAKTLALTLQNTVLPKMAEELRLDPETVRAAFIEAVKGAQASVTVTLGAANG